MESTSIMEDIIASLYEGYISESWLDASRKSRGQLADETLAAISDNVTRFVKHTKPKSLFYGSQITVEQILADLKTEPSRKLHYMFLNYVNLDGSLTHFLVDDGNVGFEAQKLGIGYRPTVVYLAEDE